MGSGTMQLPSSSVSLSLTPTIPQHSDHWKTGQATMQWTPCTHSCGMSQPWNTPCPCTPRGVSCLGRRRLWTRLASWRSIQTTTKKSSEKRGPAEEVLLCGISHLFLYNHNVLSLEIHLFWVHNAK